jgi:hypothetical protein
LNIHSLYLGRAPAAGTDELEKAKEAKKRDLATADAFLGEMEASKSS